MVQPFEADLAPETDVASHVVALHLPEASGVALHFSDFHLPAGAQLWVTNVDGTWQEGPYDFRANDVHGRIATGDVPGEWVVLRLQAPAPVMGQVPWEWRALRRCSDVEAAAVEASPVKWMWLARKSRGGNASATPPSACHHRERRLFPLLGAMVNTTALDCRQYMLTALHCASNADDDDFALLKVYYNYERPECRRAMAS